MKKPSSTKNRLIILTYFLISVYFINSFISSHFYLSLIPAYVPLLVYAFLSLISMSILLRTKTALLLLGLFFGLTLIVYMSSSNIAKLMMNYNQEKVETNPREKTLVFYGVFPSVSKFDYEKNEAEIRGLHGVNYIYVLDSGKWQTRD